MKTESLYCKMDSGRWGVKRRKGEVLENYVFVEKPYPRRASVTSPKAHQGQPGPDPEHAARRPTALATLAERQQIELT
ncbi:hypothetical protein [Halopseudomonas sp.]|uniref:hypothetical protein n=1 Tax=Halopseudomonas sp. TaxID=2901191 RepID=UPI00356A6CF1